MRHLSWNAEEPPADPPGECREPALWHESYRLWREHQQQTTGVCRCREPWPCIEYKLAIRGLMNACEPAHGIPPARAAVAVNETAACRWCGTGIVMTEFGWMHQQAALFLCKEPRHGAPVLCVAEPVP